MKSLLAKIEINVWELVFLRLATATMFFSLSCVIDGSFLGFVALFFSGCQIGATIFEIIEAVKNKQP